MFQNCEVYEDEQPPQAVLKMRKKQALSQVCQILLLILFAFNTWRTCRKTRDDVYVCCNNFVCDGQFYNIFFLCVTEQNE